MLPSAKGGVVSFPPCCAKNLCERRFIVEDIGSNLPRGVSSAEEYFKTLCLGTFLLCVGTHFVPRAARVFRPPPLAQSRGDAANTHISLARNADVQCAETCKRCDALQCAKKLQQTTLASSEARGARRKVPLPTTRFGAQCNETKMALQIFRANQHLIEVTTLIVDQVVWFKEREVTASLGYIDTTQALRKHVEEDDKKTYEELIEGGVSTTFPLTSSILTRSTSTQPRSARSRNVFCELAMRQLLVADTCIREPPPP